MSMNVGQARLRDALKQLKLRYERAQLDWDDSARREFEQQFLAPLEGQVIAAMNAMGRLSEVCSAAKRECE
jgi:hypothetical protein